MNSQTMILYGEMTIYVNMNMLKKFASHFNCDLKNHENGGTIFSSKESTRVLSKLVRREIMEVKNEKIAVLISGGMMLLE